MLQSSQSWLQTSAWRLRVHKHRWWRPLLWAGILTGLLLWTWQAATSGALQAADTIALNSAWRFVDESKPGAPPTTGELSATDNAPAPVAARFQISSSMQALALQLNENDLGGVPLGQVEQLDYCTRLVDGPRPYAVTLQLNVDADVTDADQSWQGRLVYTPAYNGAVIQGEWQCWNTLVGKWWATGGPVAEHAPADSPQPLGTLLAHFPNLGINATYSVVALKAGDGWRDFHGEASPVAIRIEGERYDVAFGVAPQPTEVLLPVVFNEPQAAPQTTNDPQDQPADKDTGKDKDKKDQDKQDKKDKQDKNNKEQNNGRGQELELNWDEAGSEDFDWESVDWDAVEWDKVDWKNVNWDKVEWDKVKWNKIDWQEFGWRGEAFRDFVDDVKECKKQGWRDAGFRNQGQCVAYYATMHSPADLTWDNHWDADWNNRWNDDWDKDWDDGKDHDDQDDDDDHDDDDDRGNRNHRDHARGDDD